MSSNMSEQGDPQSVQEVPDQKSPVAETFEQSGDSTGTSGSLQGQHHVSSDKNDKNPVDRKESDDLKGNGGSTDPGTLQDEDDDNIERNDSLSVNKAATGFVEGHDSQSSEVSNINNTASVSQKFGPNVDNRPTESLLQKFGPDDDNADSVLQKPGPDIDSRPADSVFQKPGPDVDNTDHELQKPGPDVDSRPTDSVFQKPGPDVDNADHELQTPGPDVDNMPTDSVFQKPGPDVNNTDHELQKPGPDVDNRPTDSVFQKSGPDVNNTDHELQKPGPDVDNRPTDSVFQKSGPDVDNTDHELQKPGPDVDNTDHQLQKSGPDVDNTDHELQKLCPDVDNTDHELPKPCPDVDNTDHELPKPGPDVDNTDRTDPSEHFSDASEVTKDSTQTETFSETKPVPDMGGDRNISVPGQEGKCLNLPACAKCEKLSQQLLAAERSSATLKSELAAHQSVKHVSLNDMKERLQNKEDADKVNYLLNEWALVSKKSDDREKIIEKRGEEIERLQKMLQDLNERSALQENKLMVLRKEKEEILSVPAESNEDSGQASQQLMAFSQKLKDTEKQLNECKLEKDSLNKKYQSTFTENESMKREIDKLKEAKSNLERETQELKDQAEMLSKRIQLKDVEVDEIQSKLVLSLKNIRDMLQKLESMQLELTGKDERIENLSSKEQELTDSLKGARQKTLFFKGKLQGKEKELEHLNEHTEKQTQELDNTNKEFQRQKEDLVQVKKQLEDARKRLKEKDEVMGSLNSLENETKTIVMKFHDLQKHTDSVLHHSRKNIQTQTEDTKVSKEAFELLEKTASELQVRLNRVSSDLNEKNKVLTDCSVVWTEDRSQKVEITSKNKELQKLIADLRWRLAFRCIRARQARDSIREKIQQGVQEIRDEFVKVKETVATTARKHEQEKNILKDENEGLKRNIEVIQFEMGQNSQQLTERVGQLESDKISLEELVRNHSFHLDHKQGEVNVAHAWVQKMSEAAAQSKANEDLYMKQVEYMTRQQDEALQKHQTLQGEITEKDGHIRRLHLDLESVNRQVELLCQEIRRTEGTRKEHLEKIKQLEDEIERATAEVRSSFSRNETLHKEVTKKNEEKQKLIRDVLNVKREKEAVKTDRDRLRRKSDQLEFELLHPRRQSFSPVQNPDQSPNSSSEEQLFGSYLSGGSSFSRW